MRRRSGNLAHVLAAFGLLVDSTAMLLDFVLASAFERLACAIADDALPMMIGNAVLVAEMAYELGLVMEPSIAFRARVS